MSRINLVNISVYDIDDVISGSYESIGIFRSTDDTTLVFTEITTSGTRLTLDADETYYNYEDTTGSSANVYKYKYFTSGGSASDFITSYFWANTSDLTEELRYSIYDTCTDNEEFTKIELRRYIKMAIYRLKTSNYRRQFYADKNGLIFPRVYNTDAGVILLQATIIALESKMFLAANNDMSYRDGRGSYNIRTADSLGKLLKYYKDELNTSINDVNVNYVSPLVADIVDDTYYEES